MLHAFKIISSFLTIPGIFVTIFLFLWFFYWKFGRKYGCKKGVGYVFLALSIIFYVISSNWFAYLISKTIFLTDSQDKGQYIVVLGGGIDEYDQRVEIGKHTLRRLYKAVELYRKNPRKIVITGGIIDKGTPEAYVMRDVLVNFGIPKDDIIVEDKAKNTFENGKYTYELIGDKSITLVTSSLHMKRSLWVFRKFFKEVYNVSGDLPLDFRNSYLDYLPSAGALYAMGNIAHELLGIVQYAVVYGR